MNQGNLDELWMGMAITLAKKAMIEGERPFGCVIANEDLVSQSYGTGTDLDPTRHSEMVAIRRACGYLGTADLTGCTLYSTHEPCGMCAGAIVHAHPSRVVWGSPRSALPQLFRPREITSWQIIHDCSRPPIVIERYMRDRCISLFDGELSERANEIAGF